MARFGDASSHELAPPVDVPSTARIWPFILTVCFGIVFMGIADLAWLTAIGTPGPWFTSGTSAQMYTATLTTATIATLILASLAASRLARLEARTRTEPGRDSDFVGTEVEAPSELTDPVVVPEEGSEDPDGLDKILEEIGRYATGPLVEVREKPAVRMAPAPLARSSVLQRTAEEPRDRIPPRQSFRRARRLVWQTVTGPLAMFLIYITISGAMLPATGGFAQTHYQLNTGLILFLGYGWPFLVAWTLAAIAVLNITLRTQLIEAAERMPAARVRRSR
jgi:hypothetical protein